jgi:hypothetical protein
MKKLLHISQAHKGAYGSDCEADTLSERRLRGTVQTAYTSGVAADRNV